MKRRSKRYRACCRFSERGSLLVDVAIAFAVVTLVLGIVVQVVHSGRIANIAAGGIHALNSAIDSDLYGFEILPVGTVPDTTLGAAGKTDAGASIHLMRTSSFDASYGVRTYSVAAFTPNALNSTIGGACRLEALSRPNWWPDSSDGSTGPSTHTLTLATSNPVFGRAYGAGSYGFGTTVTIRALPSVGKTFVRWDGTAQISNRLAQTTTVVVDEDRSLIAVFN